MPNKAHHEINRLSWNEGTKAHNSHKGDQTKFFRNGGDTLFQEEIQLLGDIKDKTLVHLQCNSGQDSLSIVNHLGAKVTGVDISDEAINFAKQLSQDSGILAEFVRDDVYDWLEKNNTQYDVAFSSYGTIMWLSDLKAWGQGIAKSLKSGGRFILVEFHPAFMMLEDGWVLHYDYMGGTHVEFDEGIGDYIALTGSAAEIDELEEGVKDFANPHPGVEYQWGIADIVMALVSAGLTLTAVQEYNYSNGFKMLPDMRDLGNRQYAMPEDKPQNFPLMLSIIAEKK
jgi:SAM-dependent methyltransferase